MKPRTNIKEFIISSPSGQIADIFSWLPLICSSVWLSNIRYIFLSSHIPCTFRITYDYIRGQYNILTFLYNKIISNF